jgi:hypothetical protein
VSQNRVIFRSALRSAPPWFSWRSCHDAVVQQLHHGHPVIISTGATSVASAILLAAAVFMTFLDLPWWRPIEQLEALGGEQQRYRVEP